MAVFVLMPSRDADADLGGLGADLAVVMDLDLFESYEVVSQLDAAEAFAVLEQVEPSELEQALSEVSGDGGTP
jgi:hypothetical protein